MGSLPAGSDEVVRVATPFVTVALPNTVDPLVKDTVPVTPVGSVSVNITALPTTDGFSDEVSVDGAFALVTV
jgi:hypothetical protein